WPGPDDPRLAGVATASGTDRAGPGTAGPGTGPGDLARDVSDGAWRHRYQEVVSMTGLQPTRSNTMIRSLQVVASAQFGSEAKGHVTHRVIRQLMKAYESPESPEPPGQLVNVRVAGPNAGHTVVDYQGTAWPMRQIPVGFVDPDTQLVIAPGSEVDPVVLSAEIEAVEAAGYQVRHRL